MRKNIYILALESVNDYRHIPYFLYERFFEVINEVKRSGLNLGDWKLGIFPVLPRDFYVPMSRFSGPKTRSFMIFTKI